MPHVFVNHRSARVTASAETPADRAVRRNAVLATVCGVAVMINVDLSAVTVALDDIQSDLGLSVGAMAWVLNGYALAFACAIAVAGRIGDMYGRRLALVVGTGVFFVASALCGLAQGEVWLIAARVVQGGGAALMFPAMLAIAAVTFPGRERAVAVGTIIAVASVSQAIGPLVGGALTEVFGWRAIFFINIPIGILSIWAALRFVPESRDANAPKSLDWLGAGLLTIGIAAFTVALDQSDDWGWASAATIIVLVVGVAALIAFPISQSHLAEPLITPDVLRNFNFEVTNATGAVLYFVFFPLLMYMPLLMQTVMGYGPLEAGLGLLPMVALVAFVARPVAKASERIGVTLPMTIGFALAGGAALWLGLVVDESVTYADLIAPMALVGVGIGFAVSLSTSTAVGSVAPTRAGIASGVNFAVKLIGGVIGLAIITTVFETVGDGGSTASGFVDAFEPAMFTVAAVSAAGAVFNQAFVRNPTQDTG